MKPTALFLIALAATAGCSRFENVGKAPAFTAVETSDEYYAMAGAPLQASLDRRTATDRASLWSGSRTSLLGDRRAVQRGDILTVVIQINESAEISNTTNRSRSSSDRMGITGLFGIPQRINNNLPMGATMADGVNTDSDSSYQGDGDVRRREKLTLRVAATIIETLPNGVLRIQGSQEVRVNFEVRELIVTGFVRPQDISRQNEITYDKIAGARISYGGRGQISDVQQPRYGQQIADIILPF